MPSISPLNDCEGDTQSSSQRTPFDDVNGEAGDLAMGEAKACDLAMGEASDEEASDLAICEDMEATFALGDARENGIVSIVEGGATGTGLS